MLKAIIYNLNGEKTGERELKNEVFGVKPKMDILHFAMKGFLANQRQVLAHVKTRGEVSGGGRKPWRQKGTGRARHGSIRSPLWRGGGVTFGPRKERNFKIKINKKIKRLVWRMALSERAQNQNLVLLENFDFPEPKTKIFVKFLRTLSLGGQKLLIIFPSEKENLRRMSRNLPLIQRENLNEVNAMDILNNEKILTTPEAVAYWEKIYG